MNSPRLETNNRSSRPEPSRIEFRRRYVRLNRYKNAIRYLEQKVKHLHAEARTWLTLLPIFYAQYYFNNREPLALIHTLLYNIHHPYHEAMQFLKNLLQRDEYLYENREKSFVYTASGLIHAIEDDQKALLQFITLLYNQKFGGKQHGLLPNQISLLTPEMHLTLFFQKKLYRFDRYQRRETQITPANDHSLYRADSP